MRYRAQICSCRPTSSSESRNAAMPFSISAALRSLPARGEVRSSTEIYNWTHARQRQYGEQVRQRERHSVWRILMQIAEPIGRAETIGRPWLWRLK
jgi:hypothetical protein